MSCKPNHPTNKATGLLKVIMDYTCVFNVLHHYDHQHFNGMQPYSLQLSLLHGYLPLCHHLYLSDSADIKTHGEIKFQCITTLGRFGIGNSGYNFLLLHAAIPSCNGLKQLFVIGINLFMKLLLVLTLCFIVFWGCNKKDKPSKTVSPSQATGVMQVRLAFS